MKATMGIVPADFVQRMEDHWRHELNNAPNPALIESWHQIATEFEHHIKHHDDLEKAHEWTILSPPTGSGKSESIVIYGAMLSKRADEDHPGILVVTRLIDDCNAMAERINRFGGRDTAVAYHSDVSSTIKLADLKNWPVVLMTHRAYIMALDYLGQDGRIVQTWPYYHEYIRNGQLPQTSTKSYPTQNPFTSTRRLVVIDECLDIIDHRKFTLEDLRLTLGAIPQTVWDDFPSQREAIKTIIFFTETFHEATKDGPVPELMHVMEHARTLLENRLNSDQMPDFSGLIEALGKIKFDLLQLGKYDPTVLRQLRRKHADLLFSLGHVLQSWAYYAKDRGFHTFHSARLLVPPNTKGCVVMDATANTNLVYELHEECRLVEPPSGSRDYSNVTIHTSFGHSVGKTYMEAKAKTLSRQLVDDLNGRLNGKDVLVVCHMGVEDKLSKLKTSFQLRTGHWGKVDGSNEWKNCDSVVIFGLPYLPPSWSPNVFMALQGGRTTAWLQDTNQRDNGVHKDIRQALWWGQIATNVIQAINRVRCRKTIDDKGNCETTDVYLLLPHDELANALVRDIKAIMPGVTVRDDWDYVHQKRSVKTSKKEEDFIQFFEDAPSGTYLKSDLVDEIGMSVRTINNIIAKYKDRDSDIRKALESLEVVYRVDGSGQTKKALFLKR
ncbi:DEAD/DEAH box helicase family protein [uncultured Desulfosarcina sp.]|uniref:DEAD/DEAH box helicase family protein n=1 Tax=uncultured Desulfosarcina sp. TaxID=218289 RepID=UPI0029C8E51E|nr:DEAD/DEAH box helicase family protein [uncultured Desulfosarcina sp.]